MKTTALFVFVLVLSTHAIDPCYPPAPEDSESTLLRDEPGKICCSQNTFKSICSHQGSGDDSVLLETQTVTLPLVRSAAKFARKFPANFTFPKVYPFKVYEGPLHRPETLNDKLVAAAHSSNFTQPLYELGRLLGIKTINGSNGISLEINEAFYGTVVIYNPPPNLRYVSAEYKYARVEHTQSTNKMVKSVTTLQATASTHPKDSCTLAQVISNVGPQLAFDAATECIKLCTVRNVCAPVLFCATPYEKSRGRSEWRVGLSSLDGTRFLDLTLVSPNKPSSLHVVNSGGVDCLGDNTADFLFSADLRVQVDPTKTYFVTMIIAKTQFSFPQDGGALVGDFSIPDPHPPIPNH